LSYEGGGDLNEEYLSYRKHIYFRARVRCHSWTQKDILFALSPGAPRQQECDKAY